MGNFEDNVHAFQMRIKRTGITLGDPPRIFSNGSITIHCPSCGEKVDVLVRVAGVSFFEDEFLDVEFQKSLTDHKCKGR